jgi:hypothetical protein
VDGGDVGCWFQVNAIGCWWEGGAALIYLPDGIKVRPLLLPSFSCQRHTTNDTIEFVDMATESYKKPLMALGKIPSVDVIRELLGLNAAPVTVKNAFRDMTLEWRKKSRTRNSGPATGLVDWHSPIVQEDLHTLAENFLSDKDNAERFWSASRSWKYDSKLQYPEDKQRYTTPSSPPP